jgi:hypothetical protein
MTRYARRRLLAEGALDGRCARCGGTAGPFAIDHINGGRAGYRAATGRRATIDAVADILRGDTANYQLLCRHPRTCHRDKGREDRASGYLKPSGEPA